MKLDSITIFNDIQARFEQITPQYIERLGAKLGPIEPDEKVIGVVEVGTRTLDTLLTLLRAEADLEKAKAMQLCDEHEAKDHKERSVMADQMADVVAELTWAQARADTGFWEPARIGLREGWTLVERTSPSSPAEGFMLKLGGHLLGD